MYKAEPEGRSAQDKPLKMCGILRVQPRGDLATCKTVIIAKRSQH